MSKLWQRRPSPALIVSLIALFVALGGTSYAAFSLPKNSVGTKQLKNGAVTTKKLKNGAVTGQKIANNSIGGGKIKLLTLGTVPSATSASHADEATIGDGPIAWAEVSSTGTVTAGRGVSSTNVTLNGTSAFCFHGLTFPFKSASVTPDYGAGDNIGTIAAFALGNPFGQCTTPPTTQAEVATGYEFSYKAEPFFIQFFN